MEFGKLSTCSSITSGTEKLLFLFIYFVIDMKKCSPRPGQSGAHIRLRREDAGLYRGEFRRGHRYARVLEVRDAHSTRRRAT